jgi:hypothetical protein
MQRDDFESSRRVVGAFVEFEIGLVSDGDETAEVL